MNEVECPTSKNKLKLHLYLCTFGEGTRCKRKVHRDICRELEMTQSMERSTSSSQLNLPPEDAKNGSIFKRMYNSLHRPKKGTDPFVDIADKYDQERIRDHRKQDFHQDHQQRQHYTLNGVDDIEVGEIPVRAQSWKGDTMSTFEWGPKSPPAAYRSESALLTQPSQNSLEQSDSAISTPLTEPTQEQPALIDSTLPPRADVQLYVNPKRASMLESSSNEDTKKNRQEKSKSVPPKPIAPKFKEFRPEKRERIDMDALRASYEHNNDGGTTKNGGTVKGDNLKSSNSKGDSGGTVKGRGTSKGDSGGTVKSSTSKGENGSTVKGNNGAVKGNNGTVKGKNGVVNAGTQPVVNDKPASVIGPIVSSRLPSTLLPPLILFSNDAPDKTQLNRPRHPYIARKTDKTDKPDTAGIFHAPKGLRSSSSTKNSPKREVPPPADSKSNSTQPGTARKHMFHRSQNKDPTLHGSESVTIPPPQISPRGYKEAELTRSHTEVLSNAYSPTSLRRQRSHHISTSPTTAGYLDVKISPRGLPSSPPRASTTPPPESPASTNASNNANKDTSTTRPSRKSAKLTTSEEAFDNFSLRRKAKNRLKESINGRSLAKSKASDSKEETKKKVQRHVVTAKDLAVYNNIFEGKIKLDAIFEPPTDAAASAPALSVPSTNATPPRKLSSASSPAHIPPSPKVSTLTSSSRPLSPPSNATPSASAPAPISAAPPSTSPRTSAASTPAPASPSPSTSTSPPSSTPPRTSGTSTPTSTSPPSPSSSRANQSQSASPGPTTENRAKAASFLGSKSGLSASQAFPPVTSSPTGLVASPSGGLSKYATFRKYSQPVRPSGFQSTATYPEPKPPVMFTTSANKSPQTPSRSGVPASSLLSPSTDTGMSRSRSHSALPAVSEVTLRKMPENTKPTTPAKAIPVIAEKPKHKPKIAVRDDDTSTSDSDAEYKKAKPAVSTNTKINGFWASDTDSTTSDDDK